MPPEDFPRSARLRRPGEFAAVLAERRRVRKDAFELRYRANEAGSRARLGLVIPKRLARKAVLRNRIKRILREAFRHRCADLPAVDLVIRLVQSIDRAAGPAAGEQKREWRRLADEVLDTVCEKADGRCGTG